MSCRCLIVDDEDWILERLEQFFDKHRDEFELVGKAYSGAEGMEQALQKEPDIVLTDIVMPEINGIDMIERLRSRLPHTEFILLSAYSDFEYAKRAMQINVQEYIEKVPLSEQTVLGSLRRARHRLEQQRNERERIHKLSRHRLENIHRVRRQLTEELIRGDTPLNRLTGLAESMNADESLMESFCCMVIEWTDFARFKAGYQPHHQATIRYGMINILEETIREQGLGFACERSDERLLAVVSWGTMNSEAELYARSVEIGQKLIFNIRNFMKMNIHVGISAKYRGWDMLAEAYREASALCSYGYYSVTSEVFTRSKMVAVKGGQERLIAAFSRLPNVLQDTPYGEVQALLEEVRAEALRVKLPREEMIRLIKEFIDNLFRKATASRKDTCSWPEFGRQGMTFESHWQVLAESVRHYVWVPPASGKQEIVKAKHYIETHLSQRLSLEEVAQEVHLAPTYFSTMFKKETGEKFVDYVNQRKIQRAAALLKDREYSNAQLCNMVGIQSEKYLCTLFKEMYGMPPQKFSKSIR